MDKAPFDENGEIHPKASDFTATAFHLLWRETYQMERLI